jgi:hypothetical protein
MVVRHRAWSGAVAEPAVVVGCGRNGGRQRVVEAGWVGLMVGE